MAQRRLVAGFIPYRIVDGTASVFLQRRTDDAPTHPGHLTLFGGGEEPQDKGDPERVLAREVLEELCISPVGYDCFLVWGDAQKHLHVFTQHVSDGWEASVIVREGKSGQFYSESDIRAEPLVTPLIREVLYSFFSHIRATL